jgi:hypothetical protein
MVLRSLFPSAILTLIFDHGQPSVSYLRPFWPGTCTSAAMASPSHHGKTGPSVSLAVSLFLPFYPQSDASAGPSPEAIREEWPWAMKLLGHTRWLRPTSKCPEGAFSQSLLSANPIHRRRPTVHTRHSGRGSTAFATEHNLPLLRFHCPLLRFRRRHRCSLRRSHMAGRCYDRFAGRAAVMAFQRFLAYPFGALRALPETRVPLGYLLIRFGCCDQ